MFFLINVGGIWSLPVLQLPGGYILKQNWSRLLNHLRELRRRKGDGMTLTVLLFLLRVRRPARPPSRLPRLPACVPPI